ncbi:MAG: nucleotidyltransferase family protein, partial [Bacteroidota bacterium]|nr:nucleotidyltransferase family protein [Bacteroidota bacterium]
VSEAIKVTPEVIVVLGSNYDAVKKEIENFPVQIIYNKDWEEGMSSSIRSGFTVLLNKNAPAEAVVIVVCDQPFLSSTIIMEIIKKYETTKKPIVACAYKDIIGTPVLFHKTFFQPLTELKGHAGAKKIISQNMDVTVTVPFPLGDIDIDTKDDFENLKRLNNN